MGKRFQTIYSHSRIGKVTVIRVLVKKIGNGFFTLRVQVSWA